MKPIPVELVQFVRVLDVFVIGPAIVFVALTCRISPLLSLFLVATGIGTVIFNGYSFLQSSSARPP